MKPIVTVTNIFPQAALDKLAPECDLKTNDSGVSSTAEELGRMVSESDAVISYLTDKIGRDIIDQSTKLKIIANYGAGFNNIDVNYASERGIWVTNTPSVLHETTADLTWAMILGAARRIVPADRFTREGKFKGWSAKMFLGGDVYGKTLGVIGCGEIGRSVVRRASGFNMRVLYHQRNRLPEEEERMLNAEFISLDQLLRESDFITLHVPLTDETEYMIGNDEIALMKKTAYLIHTARRNIGMTVLMLHSDLLEAGDIPVDRTAWTSTGYQVEMEQAETPLEWAIALQASLVGRGSLLNPLEFANLIVEAVETPGFMSGDRGLHGSSHPPKL